MNDKNDGGSAFPVPYLVSVNGEVQNLGATGGMSLRDWFAGQALAQMVQIVAEIESHRRRDDEPWHSPMAKQWDDAAAACGEKTLDYTAQFCYLLADAMLAERAKREARND